MANVNRPRNYNQWQEQRCFNCGKLGHKMRECRQPRRQQGNWNNQNQNINQRNDNQNRNENRNQREFNNRNNYQSNRSNQQPNLQRNNQGTGNERTYANYAGIEEEPEEEYIDEETKEIIALLNGNQKDNKKGIKRKNLGEPEIIYDWETNKKHTKKKDWRTEMMDIDPIKPKKKVTFVPKRDKTEKGLPIMLEGSDFDIVKTLKNQKIEISLQQLLKKCPTEKKKLIEALRKPKEAYLIKQEYTPKATTLECRIGINEYTVPATIDSGAATSIISRETMEQLGYGVETTTDKRIISANGAETKSLGRIKDFPIEVDGNVIPTDVEVMETDAYYLLLGNDWMMKAGASYDWKKQELTLNWRNRTIKTSAKCTREDQSDESEEEFDN
jgi:hypothetical protein